MSTLIKASALTFALLVELLVPKRKARAIQDFTRIKFEEDLIDFTPKKGTFIAMHIKKAS